MTRSSPPSFIDPPAPGSRVRVRGEEWAVEKCLPLPTGGDAVYVQGVSELVRYHKAIFLTPIDTDIVPLRPEDTRLVADPSPEYQQSALYIETLFRRTPPTHNLISVGHKAALDVMPYQLVPAQRCLSRLQPRLLIADGTGLGKTIEIGIILSELIKRGRGRRILVVAIRSMLEQLQRELWARFTIPLVRLDADGITRVQSKIPATRNPFSYFDRVIVSMDTLKNHGRYRAWLEEIRWDAIVVDECHNVANRSSQRADLARLLAAQCDALVLTSATPHNGRPESFANLMRMVDPTRIADPTTFTKTDVEDLFVRRFKKDVEREAGGQLRDRETHTHDASATESEERAVKAIHALRLRTLGRKQKRDDVLFKWTLIKAFLSSADACLETLDKRLTATAEAIASPDSHPRLTEITEDLAHLREARARVADAQSTGSSKFSTLVSELRKIGFDGTKASPRVVIFSERIATLEMLKRELERQFSLKAQAVGVFTASETDETEQSELIKSFGHADSALRVLLCSDAASEGVNLHHQCHHLFHFDIPWSLIRLTQRSGRIDRFGQKSTPHLHYVVLKSHSASVDQHVVDRLINKEKEVERQLGDPGALLGLYDAEREEVFIARGIAAGKGAHELIPDSPRAAAMADEALGVLAEPGDTAESGVEAAPEGEASQPPIDLLKLFAEVELEQAKTPTAEALISDERSLFSSDYELLVAALRLLERSPVIGPEPLRWETDEEKQVVTIHAPEPFRRHREGFLPREAVPDKGQPYRFVAGIDLMSAGDRAGLDDEGRWPRWHLLWEQHPLIEWLLDSVTSAYARGEAPILLTPALGKNEAIFLLQGSMFNSQSEAVVTKWLGFVAHDGMLANETLELNDTLSRVGFTNRLANSGRSSVRTASLQDLVPGAVNAMLERLKAERAQYVDTTLRPAARKEARRLEAWATKSEERLARIEDGWKKAGKQLPKHVARKLAHERGEILAAKHNHTEMLDAAKRHGSPHVRLVAVFTGD